MQDAFLTDFTDIIDLGGAVVLPPDVVEAPQVIVVADQVVDVGSVSPTVPASGDGMVTVDAWADEFSAGASVSAAVGDWWF